MKIKSPASNSTPRRQPPAPQLEPHPAPEMTGEALLDELQRDSFGYFLHEINLENGLIADKSCAGWPASIAAVGMALAAYPVAVERGYLTRARALQRTLTTLRFLRDSPQSDAPDATGYRGFYYHFLDMQSGRRAWNCELSSIDTALLLAGVLTAAQYFAAENDDEKELRHLAELLYRRVDWQWMAHSEDGAIAHGWRPERGFLPYHWRGYDEALILYILALGAPEKPLAPRSYAAWSSTYKWKKIYGFEYLYAGPLFIHQLSHLWIDFREIQDEFMRGKGSNYFENSRRATYVQREYAIRNPRAFTSYSESCWGVTASDGPGPGTLSINGRERRFYDYKARGAPHGPDDGSVAPWAVVASLPFAPEIVLPAVQYFNRIKLRESDSYGFKATFNPTYPSRDGNAHGWVSPWHFGINQGPIVTMIENYRSGLPWRLMRRCPFVRNGLQRAGFRGGWLE